MTMFAQSPSFWRDRLRASGAHLGISLLIASVAALLVLGVWYPYPYRAVSGGRELFFLVVTVDVILGPLITLAIFDRRKAWPILRRDLLIISFIQLCALGYGLHTVYVARPVHLVFEYNRFSVVHAVDIPVDLLPKAPAAIEPLPVLGPTPLSLRPFKDDKEKSDATWAALQGLDLPTRPDLWQPYENARAEILKEAKPASQLLTRFPAEAGAIREAMNATGQPIEKLVYLPMISRKLFWTVILDATTAQVLTFVPVDSF